MSVLVVDEYIDNGKNIIFLKKNEKLPLYKGWTTEKRTKEEVEKHKGNFGWALGHNDFVIDVDFRNGGHVSFENLKNDTGIDLMPTVVTPGGGFHIYLKSTIDASAAKFKKNLKQYPGIDFLRKGHFVVIPPSRTENGTYHWFDEDLGIFEQTEIPSCLLELFKEGGRNIEFGNTTLNEWGITESSFWTEEKVLEMLSKLDPSEGNEYWVKVGMALKEWDANRGLQFWEKWSQAGTNYTPGETAKRWKSFKVGMPGGVTMGSLANMAKNVVFDKEVAEANRLVELISRSSEEDINNKIGEHLRKGSFSPYYKEKITDCIRNRLKQLGGASLTSAKAKKIFFEEDKSQLVYTMEKPEWCKDWAYILNHEAYIKLSTLQIYKIDSFNLENTKKVRKFSNSKLKAKDFVQEYGLIPSVDGMIYLPSHNDRILKINGKTLINIFNQDSIPDSAASYTEEGKEAVKRVLRHLSFICNYDETNTAILTQWIAHNVQFPGKKILYAPLIQSIDGMGKSFFTKLFKAMLGNENVGVINPQAAVSAFNGWAMGKCINVIEEIRIKGQNRHEAVNALKPLITDETIQINKKGVNQFEVNNTTNYIAFTNFKDSLPLTEHDRRWFVIFVEVNDISELPDRLGEPPVEYFNNLFDAVKYHGGELRRFFLNYKITKEFCNLRRAPNTIYKYMMVTTEQNAIDGLLEVKALIAEGGQYFNNTCLSFQALYDEFLKRYPEIYLTPKYRQTILRRLGFLCNEKRIKLDNKLHTIWTKQPMTAFEIRTFLKGPSDFKVDY